MKEARMALEWFLRWWPVWAFLVGQALVGVAIGRATEPTYAFGWWGAWLVGVALLDLFSE